MAHGQKQINVTLIGKVLPKDSLTLALSARLRFYGLQGAKLNVVQGDNGMAATGSLAGHSVKEIYEIAQTSLVQKQQQIDSLRTLLDARNADDSISAHLAPELKVIFPQVAEIAITKAVFGNIDSGGLDTANIALVNYAKPISADSRNELARYLAARLRVNEVELVQVDKQQKQQKQ